MLGAPGTGDYNFIDGAFVYDAGNGNYTQDEAPDGTIDFYMPQVTMANRYYPFGMVQPNPDNISGSTRYGFNGMERDGEVTSGSYTTPFRELDVRLGGRWWSRDPIVKPWESPYAGFANNPIYYKDPSGLDPKKNGDKGGKKERRADKHKKHSKGKDRYRQRPGSDDGPRGGAGEHLPGGNGDGTPNNGNNDGPPPPRSGGKPVSIGETIYRALSWLDRWVGFGIRLKGAPVTDSPIGQNSDAGLDNVIEIDFEYIELFDRSRDQYKKSSGAAPFDRKYKKNRRLDGEYQQKDHRRYGDHSGVADYYISGHGEDNRPVLEKSGAEQIDSFVEKASDDNHRAESISIPVSNRDTNSVRYVRVPDNEFGRALLERETRGELIFEDEVEGKTIE